MARNPSRPRGSERPDQVAAEPVVSAVLEGITAMECRATNLLAVSRNVIKTSPNPLPSLVAGSDSSTMPALQA